MRCVLLQVSLPSDQASAAPCYRMNVIGHSTSHPSSTSTRARETVTYVKPRENADRITPFCFSYCGQDERWAVPPFVFLPPSPDPSSTVSESCGQHAATVTSSCVPPHSPSSTGASPRSLSGVSSDGELLQWLEIPADGSAAAAVLPPPIALPMRPPLPNEPPRRRSASPRPLLTH